MSSLFLWSMARFLRAVATAQTTLSTSIRKSSTKMGRPFSFRTAALNHAKSLVSVPVSRIFRKFFSSFEYGNLCATSYKSKSIFGSIADPGCWSRIRIFSIPAPGSASNNLMIRTQKHGFLSSRKYDPGCSSRIQILIFYPSRIPDVGVKKAPKGKANKRRCHEIPLSLTWYLCWAASSRRTDSECLPPPPPTSPDWNSWRAGWDRAAPPPAARAAPFPIPDRPTVRRLSGD